MKCITLPYGTAGWDEKNRIFQEIFLSRPGPPFIYNDVLVIVPSSRMKRIYGRMFLDLVAQRGSFALVQPEVQTLHQFFEALYARFHGPELIDENSRLVLLEGLVKERLISTSLFQQSPDLLAPSLSSALAGMVEQLAAAGVTPDDLLLKIRDAEYFDKPQVGLLIDVYTRYNAILKERNLVDPSGMRAMLRDRFDPSWLSRYSRIIIDNVQDAGLVDAAILKKLSACQGCSFLVAAPSAGLVDHVAEFHPLRITQEFLRALGLTLSQEKTAPPAADEFLASALFSDRSFQEVAAAAPPPQAFAKDLNLLSAVNTREEVSLIAGRVKRSLRNGTAPDSILIAFPALDAYGPLVEEVLNDYGIPYNRALGRQLSTSPVAAAALSLLRSCQEDFSGPSLLRVFSSPFLKFSEQPSIAPALDRFMRDQRITGGREKLLAALRPVISAENSKDHLIEPLRDLFTALKPFSEKDAASLPIWMDRLADLITWSGLHARVDRIHGPLNINLQAAKKLDDTLASLHTAGKLFPEYTYTFNEWLFLLKRTFMHARFQVPPEDEGGVQILGFEESMGHPWTEVYLGGLTDNAFPQRLPQNIFLPEQSLEAMGVRTLEKARLNAAYHFYRLMLSADRITLTFPENEGDRPVVPSPFLAELTPLRDAGLIKTAAGIQSSLKIEDSQSLPELAKAIGLAEQGSALQNILHADSAGMSGIRAAVASLAKEARRATARVQQTTFRVTELDDYLNCPYKYYVENVLGLGPLEEVSEDMTSLDRGSKVHAILRNFYLSWDKPVTRADRNAAEALLTKLADSAFDREADTVRNRREKSMFLNKMAKRFLDAEEAFWKQGMRPAYLEQKIDTFELSLSDGTIVSLTGKIDRIDVDPHGNFIIVDYKTGQYPLSKSGIDQIIFQLPIYAIMAQQALRSKGPALNKPIGLAYYDLAAKTDAGARDVVLFNRDIRNDHPSSKPKTSPKTPDEFDAILKQSLVKARIAIESILAGTFPAKPQDENKCRYCPNEMMCEQEES